MESSKAIVENSEVSIPLSFFMLPESKLKNLSTKLRIQWTASNVELGIEPKDGIEDADDLLKFVLEKVDSRKPPLWHIMKAITDFYTSIVDQEFWQFLERTSDQPGAMESSKVIVENSEVSIPLSFFMLPESKLKNLSTKLRIQWTASNVELGIEPKDGIEDADDLLKFVLEKVDSRKPPLWHIMKAITDFYTSVRIVDEDLSFYSKYYEEMNPLGIGGFGAVFQCKNKLDGALYAVKVIPFSDKCEKDTFKELRAIFFFHPNIVRYHKAWVEAGVPNHLQDLIDDTSSDASRETTQSSDSGKTLYLLMEHCKCTLDEELAAGKDFTGSEVLNIFRAAIEGICYVHSKNLCHGDISTTNIFLDFNGVAKLGDFGLIVEDDLIERVIGGKVKYHPPELKSNLPGEMVKTGIWTKACDVYALAVVMVELVFTITTDMELCKLLERWNNEREFPPQTKLSGDDFDVLKSMLTSNDSDRPCAEAIRLMICG